MDDAIKTGATRIDGIKFIAIASSDAQAQQQAIQKASEDAKKQANAALDALNLLQQEVIGIQINQATPPQPQNYASPAANTSSIAQKAETPIVGGEQKVEQTVTRQIRY